MAPSHSGQRRSHRLGWKGILAIFIVLIVVGYFSVRLIGSKMIESQMNLYRPINDDSPIAQLDVTKTSTNLRWMVRVSTYDSSGNLIVNTKSFLAPCDHWVLKANVVTISPWLVLAVPSVWYRLTDLEGSHCYDQHGKLTASIEKIRINRSEASLPDGGFLNAVKSIPVASTSIQPDGVTYNVIITPTSLSITPKS